MIAAMTEIDLNKNKTEEEQKNNIKKILNLYNYFFFFFPTITKKIHYKKLDFDIHKMSMSDIKNKIEKACPGFNNFNVEDFQICDLPSKIKEYKELEDLYTNYFFYATKEHFLKLEKYYKETSYTRKLRGSGFTVDDFPDGDKEEKETIYDIIYKQINNIDINGEESNHVCYYSRDDREYKEICCFNDIIELAYRMCSIYQEELRDTSFPFESSPFKIVTDKNNIMHISSIIND